MTRTLALILSFFLFTASGCNFMSMSNVQLKSKTSASSFEPSSYGSVGVKHVDQLMLSMTAVTGLSPLTTVSTNSGTQTLASLYSNITPFLSSNGDVATVNASMLLAITGFAGNVCTAWLIQEAAAENSRAGSSSANSGVNFKASGSGSGASQFRAGSSSASPTIVSTVVNQYAQLFWGRAPTDDEIRDLSQAIMDSAAAITDTGSKGAQEVLLVPCTAMLASPAFLAS